jgi:hypothetical protein
MMPLERKRASAGHKGRAVNWMKSSSRFHEEAISFTRNETERRYVLFPVVETFYHLYNDDTVSRQNSLIDDDDDDENKRG